MSLSLGGRASAMAGSIRTVGPTFRDAFKSRLLRNVMALISGAVFSQSMMFLFSPWLARIYSASDFGTLANYNAWVAALALLSSLRYEHAVIVATSAENLDSVVVLTGLLSFFSCILYLGFAAALHAVPIAGGYLENMREIAWFIPVGVAFTCTSSLLAQVNVKEGWFRRLATVAPLQIVATVGPQIALALAGVKNGLILGAISGYAFASVVYLWFYIRDHGIARIVSALKMDRLIATARQYANFPRYMVVADGVTIVVQQFVPVFVLALYSPAIAGLYAFATRVVRLPLLVISAAFASGLRKEASDRLASGTPLGSLFSGTVRLLFALSVIPFTVLAVWAKPLFAFVFGDKWVDAGRLVQVLSPGILLEFVAVPLTIFFLVTETQRFSFRIQIAGFIGLITALLVGRQLFQSFIATSVLISVVMVAVNLTSIFLAAHVSGQPVAETTIARDAPAAL